uniref:CHK kinase-like domain-containing protein n=1 Tax=Clastoptera arizonana TaxID=38151 RepID=A0A1B6DZ85_9HEMI
MFRSEKFIRKAFGSDMIDSVVEAQKGEDQFSSSVEFVKVELKHGEVDVVVKMQSESTLVRDTMSTDVQFHNEVNMYRQILPYFNSPIVEELFPKCFFGVSTLGDYAEDCVVLQNMKTFGYRQSRERFFLDYDHVTLALRRLGAFHSCSYKAKEADLDGFLKKVNSLKEVYYDLKMRDEMNQYFAPYIERGMVELLKNGEHTGVLKKFAARLEDPFTFLKDIVEPEEPIAVLCHGDFCRNNILFKYEDGRPIGVSFFDLGTSRYSSPAVDLSFFLFLNVPSQLRKDHWNDFLSAYHEGLSASGTKVPSLEMIHAEMQKKAVYAYPHCCAFIPTMMDFERVKVMMAEGDCDLASKVTGGDEAAVVVADILRDLVGKQCLGGGKSRYLKRPGGEQCL